jgi:predicted AlkP superfamily pyrophosphatase or phosphodiesterase
MDSMRKLLVALGLAVAVAAPAQQPHQPVLMISIDGMRPDYVTQAGEHHLSVPNLRRVLAEGTHADGVRGVFPTVTYPSHTTLVTGVWPAQHGIYDNTRFDPEHKLDGAWYWYAPQIQVPTLYTAAHTAGLHTASVSWPVTVDATNIEFDIPEYWRTSEPHNPDDLFLMAAITRPDGELDRIRARTGKPYMEGNDTTLDGDRTRTIYSLDILQQHKPEFMTVHLSSLDEAEHLHGPFSPEANADLEVVDGMVGQLVAQELANFPNAVIAIVSDHGFVAVDHLVNLGVPFVAAGLIRLKSDDDDEIASWTAQAWSAGGMSAIMLHDDTDLKTRNKVGALLKKLAADPANGIEAVLNHGQALALGGFPGAAFVVTFKPGYVPGPALTGPVVTPTPPYLKGMHGYNPETTPAMRASFFITGPGIAKGRDLGLIDMRQIAPTLAGLLGVALPSAGQPPLQIH